MASEQPKGKRRSGRHSKGQQQLERIAEPEATESEWPQIQEKQEGKLDEEPRPQVGAAASARCRESMRVEAMLRRRTHDLDERVKELSCLYAISRLTLRPGISLTDIFRGTVEVIPAAWQYPAITCARVLFKGQAFSTENFQDTPWKQASNIVIGDKVVGAVEVGYLEERPLADEGPFLKEERRLIDAIAERLTQAIQHKQAEEALQASEAKYRSIIEQSHDGIVLVDMHGKILEWNRAQERIFGLKREQAMGRLFWDVQFEATPQEHKTPAVYEQLKRAITALLDTEDGPWPNQLLERDIQRPNGERRTIQSLAFPVHSGTQLMIGSIVRDITEPKLVQDALQHSQEQVRILSDNVRSLVVYRYRLLPTSGFEYVSPSVALVTGYTPEEFYADAELLFKNAHQDDRLLAEATVRSPDSVREPISLRWIHKDGDVIWLEQRQVPVYNESGELIAVEGVLSDVTDRRRVEEALRESERRQDILLQSAPVAVFRKEASGDFGTIWASEKARAITGFPSSRFVEDKSFWAARVHPDDRENALAQYRRALYLSSVAFEYRWRCADDSYHWFVDRAVLARGERGGPDELVVTSMDISDRKRRSATGQGLTQPYARTHLVSPSGNWRKVVIALPETQTVPVRRPQSCPRCGSTVLQRHQTISRSLRGKEGHIEVVRYLCTACGRTFCHYPEGASQSQQSREMQLLVAILYGLGLSIDRVREVLLQAGMPLSRTSIWRIARRPGETMRQSRPAGLKCLLAREDSPIASEFVVVEKVQLNRDERHVSIELLIWERQGAVFAWLSQQLESLGATQGR